MSMTRGDHLTETELRRLAEAARTLLHLLISDVAEVARLRRLLDAALALPTGRADMALLRALSDNAVLRGWVAEQRTRQFRAPMAYLSAQLPEVVPQAHDFSLLVQLTAIRRRLSTALHGVNLEPDGTMITITVWAAPGLRPLTHLRQEVRAPVDGDSPPVEFGFRGVGQGVQAIVVHAFAGGTFLGELSAEVRVRDGAGVEPSPLRMTGLPATDAKPGDVTLEVSRTPDDRYSVRLIGGGTGEVELSDRLVGEPRWAIQELLGELRRFAAGRSGFNTAQARRDRLRSLGVNLWSQTIPEAIRQQFWDLGDGIRSFRVLSDADPLPWELLYPLDGARDRGFLIDQFPVVRQVGPQSRSRSLPLRSMAFVVSNRRLANAEEEIRRISGILGPDVLDRGRVSRLNEMAAMLEAPPGLLHFVCHNQFTDGAEALVSLVEGPFRPSDLAVAAAMQSLAGAAPVVFFNSCRSADEIPGLTRPVGWARQFMAAGAGAFLGTLWPVSSAAALRFAEAFYGSFVTKRLPLGAAVSQARTEVADDNGDPTWLAYAVYGEPDATARMPAGGGGG